MKRFLRRVCVCTLVAIMLLLCACREADKNYGAKSNKNTKKVKVGEKYTEIEIPEISSDDTIMPKYLDISIYDVENYANVYLGKDFKYDANYCGEKLSLPATYKKMNESGWSMIQTDSITAESMVLATEKLAVEFKNEQGKLIKALFYNPKSSSVSLEECEIVKFSIEHNYLETDNQQYGEFWINGISNTSSINDIIEALGVPSHFYGVSDEIYYLDYFYTEKDRRSRITVYVNTVDDCVISVEFSKYS